jgi:hypothetical protein
VERRRHNDAARLDRQEQLILCLAADGIDHRVGAPRKVRETLGPELLRLGINDFMGAQAAHIVGAVTMNSSDHVQSARAPELHCVGPDITTATVNDDGNSY